MPFKNPHPLYSIWQGMLRRCYTPTSPSYKHYGGRGLTVCSRWKNSFHNFASDMGERPGGYSIERINNNKGYSPDNCKWANRKEQQRNQKVTRIVTIEGKQYKAADLADIAKIKTDNIVERVNRGLSYKEVISSGKLHNLDGLRLGGNASGAKKQTMTHCKHGHEFTKTNTYISKQGWRICRKCRATREAKRRKLNHF